MTASSIYLDYAASAPLRPEALAAFARVGEMGGNASSVHGLGRKAKLALEEARAEILAGVGAQGSHLVFTAGGTEANAQALHQARLDLACDTLIVGEGEHDSLYVAADGVGKTVVHAPLTTCGKLKIEALQALIVPGCHVFVQLVNNETGVINDIRAVAEIVHTGGGRLHVDAVQALGKIAIDFEALGADSLSLAAHKVGGPQGVGALIARRELTLKSLILGGGQELGLRAGTENVAGIAAFAAALMASNAQVDGLAQAQADVEQRLIALGVTVVGADVARAPGILCTTQAHWPSPQQLINMDMAGICVSSGSACSSGKVKPSRILTVMGLGDMAGNVLRISSGWRSSADDWNRFYDVWSKGYEAFLKRHDITKSNEASLYAERV
jgi:cysteine desulfurase